MWCRPAATEAWLLILAALIAAPAAGSPPAGLAGRPLDAVIDELSARGLSIFYSSDLVRPSLLVVAEPEAEDALAVLAQILEPHGLVLRPGLNSSWLIVRGPRAREPEPSAAPRAEPPPAAHLPQAPSRPIEEIVVSATRYEIQRSVIASRLQLGQRELELSPDIGDDAIRAVARLPGMAPGGFNALANVRGGEIGETLVRLDGLRLYEPFHLKDFQGVFSVIDPRVVGGMDVYTGGFPALYGDRMSGVIDVETIRPPRERYHEIGLSFFNSSILSAGEFLDGSAEWLASIRRSNLDALYDRFSEQPDGPTYMDAFAKLRVAPSDRLAITVNMLRATDDIVLADDVDREESATASQADTYAWIRLEHELNGRMSATTIVAASSIDSLRRGTSAKAGVSAGWLHDQREFSFRTLSSDWTRVIGTRSLLDFGLGVTWMSGRYRYREAVEFDLLFDVAGAPEAVSRSRDIELEPAGRQIHVYGSLRSDLTARLAIDAGVRIGTLDLERQSSPTLGPRLGLRFAMTERMTLRASWGRIFQSQGITELAVSDGETRHFRPQRSEHFVLGLDRQLASDASMRIELYDKSMSSLRPRYENLINTRVLLPELKPDRLRVWPEDARARGIELSFAGGRDSLRWWGSLTWARVRDRIAGQRVPRSWDQPFALSTGVATSVGNWNLSAGFIYRSGWPTTSVALEAATEFPLVRAGPRNSMRMGPFGTLDLRVSRAIQFDQSRLEVFFELANVSGRESPCCHEYEIGDEDEAGLLILDEQPLLARIPSLGLTWAF